jgi:uncharacterized protein
MNARHPLTRREFVWTATTATAAVVAQLGRASAEATPNPPRGLKPGRPDALIDVNVTLGRWPFRRVPFDDTSALVDKLRDQGVVQAWAGTFDGLFHKDLAAANTRLAEDCRRHGRGLLRPFGSVNPKLPDWEDDLRRCAETHQMPGIRLHPSYHGYPLDDPAFIRLLALAGERRLIVQIVADMEDERTQHPLARAPHADFKPLPALLKAQPGVRVMLLNWFRSVNMVLARQLAAVGASFDIATLENVGGVENLVQQISAERVVFGSHAPLFYFESAILKLKESALPAATGQAIRNGNVRRLAATAADSRAPARQHPHERPSPLPAVVPRGNPGTD